MRPVNVHELGQNADAATVNRWEAFVETCPEATFFHRAGWRTVLAEAFGHRPYFLYAESGGEVRGVLPLARQKSMLFGDALVSTPFCVYGGVAASDAAARAALERAAVELGERLGVDHVEFRNLSPRRDDWERRESNATFRKAIAADPEQNLLGIPRKQRAEVRKGMERGLAAAAAPDPDLCWRLYARSVHRHGSPVYARRYFHDLARVFGRDCEFYFVRWEGRAVASLLNLYFRDEVLPYYAGSASGGRDGEVHPFMYWSLMNHAAARGARQFDFGRSPVGSGTYAFKKNFGFEPQPLAYEYRLVRAKHVPEADPKSPRYALLVNTWRRLPLALANVIGPWAARQIG
jgi:FemAB-related protein (PEP-CTERM system-associated)